MEKTAPLGRILVVEDEMLTGLSIEHMLIDAGYHVVAVAVSAQEALLAVQLSNPDLVLMDICVRGDMDGIDAALQIREETRLPVIFVTGSCDGETLKRAREVKPFGYIVKPISRPSLISTIDVALYKHRAECEDEQHREWLAMVLDSVPQGLIAVDVDSNITFLNKQAAKLTGCTAKTVMGKRITDFVHLLNKRGEDFTPQLMEQTTRSGSVTLPRGTTISRWDCSVTTPVEGDAVATYVKGSAAGIILSLRETPPPPPAPPTPPRKDDEARQVLIGRVLLTIGRGLLAIGKLHF